MVGHVTDSLGIKCWLFVVWGKYYHLHFLFLGISGSFLRLRSPPAQLTAGPLGAARPGRSPSSSSSSSPLLVRPSGPAPEPPDRGPFPHGRSLPLCDEVGESSSRFGTNLKQTIQIKVIFMFTHFPSFTPAFGTSLSRQDSPRKY